MLDGEKRKVLTVASNPGHLLWSGIVPPERAARVVARLMAPDMNSGWGIRTLSADASGVQSVLLPERLGLAARQQPDRARLQALRLRRGSRPDRARHLASRRATSCSTSCRNCIPACSAATRGFPVQYLGANVPQAWAAGSVFALLQAILGITLDAPRGASSSIPCCRLAAGHHVVRSAARPRAASTSASGATAMTTQFEVLRGDRACRWQQSAVPGCGRPQA